MIEGMNSWSASSNLLPMSPGQPEVAATKVSSVQKSPVPVKSTLPVSAQGAPTVNSGVNLKPAEADEVDFSVILASTGLPQAQVPPVVTVPLQGGYARNLTAPEGSAAIPALSVSAEQKSQPGQLRAGSPPLVIQQTLTGGPVQASSSPQTARLQQTASQLTGRSLPLDVLQPLKSEVVQNRSKIPGIPTQPGSLTSSTLQSVPFTPMQEVAIAPASIQSPAVLSNALSAPLQQSVQQSMQPWLMGPMSGLSGKPMGMQQATSLEDSVAIDGMQWSGGGEVLDIQKTPAFKGHEISGKDFTDLMSSVTDSRLSRSKLKDKASGQDLSPVLRGGVGQGVFDQLQESKLKTKFSATVPGDQLSGTVLSAAQLKAGTAATVPMEMTAQVTSGANTIPRLATDSLINLSTNIRGIAATGGGVIHVRLRPENLGELSIRISTRNGRMGIDFQASDQKSKSIIEDSLHFLKESLTSQQIATSQVDFSVGIQKQDAPDLAQFNFDLNQGKNQGSAEQRQFFQQGENSARTFEDPVRRSSAQLTSLHAPLTRTGAAALTQGRLDVTA